MSAALVSVIIPVYNCERYLAEAVESVLVQTYQPLDVIVVDDGSTDRSARVASNFAASVRYCFQPHSGIGAARNRGVESAQGGFLAFLDADDLWTEDKLARQMAAFAQNPELHMIFGHVSQFISPDLDPDQAAGLLCPAGLVPGYSASTMLMRREAWMRVGPFETNWLVGEFIDWYLKAIEQGLKSLMLPDFVLRRRLHATNQGTQKRDARLDYVRILKASLDRRRNLGLQKAP